MSRRMKGGIQKEKSPCKINKKKMRAAVLGLIIALTILVIVVIKWT